MRKKIAVMSNFIELDKMKNELSFGIFKILQIEEEKRAKRWNPISERPNLSGSGSGSAELGGSVGSVVRPNQQVRSAEPKPNHFTKLSPFSSVFDPKYIISNKKFCF